MLQPRTYPELIGKAFFLEPDPFLVMAHDDEPLSEGALLAACIGVVVGGAQVVGNLLQGYLAPAAIGDPFVAESVADQARLRSADIALWMADPLRAGLFGWQAMIGVDTGWWQALLLIATPVLMILAWLIIGTLLWLVGRMLGGIGDLPHVLGASALVLAPALFYALHIVPFTFVNFMLPLVWGVLLLYRAAQMSHDLDWTRALGVTAVCVLLLTMGGLLFGAGTLLVASMV